MNHILTLIVFLLTPLISFSQGTWTQVANYGGGATTEARAFGIGAFGYVGANSTDFWQYDPSTDTWTQKAAFIGPSRNSAVGFSIGTKGYFGTGGSYNDFYEYDQVTNTWTQKANFGGSGREGAVGCAIDGKGYIGTGGSYFKDWWEYDPATDTWTQKADLTGPTRYHGGSFAIGGKGYICTGFNGSFFNDLWEFDPLTNLWTAKSPLPGNTRDRPVAMAVNGKGYILGGWTGGTALNDAWEYDPVADSWTQIPNFPGAPRYNACGFVAGTKLYIGTGYSSGTLADFYEYGPACAAQLSITAPTCFDTCDGSAVILSPLPGPGVSYLWSDGSTSASVAGLCDGNYTVTVTDSSGCQSTQVVPVIAPDSIEIFTTFIEPLCFGDSTGSVCLQTSGGTPPVTDFLWSTGSTGNCLQGVPGGNYMVTVTDSAGCGQSFPVLLNQPSQIQIAFTHLDASCSTCPNGVASATPSGGTPPYTYQWSNGSTLPIQNGLLPGTYTLCVTDSSNCVMCDTVVISFTSSVNDLSDQEKFRVWPNPASDALFISSDIPVKYINSVTLLDVAGKRSVVPLRTSSDVIQLDLSSLESGVYIVEISGEGFRWHRTVVIE